MKEFLSTPWVITIGWILGALGWIAGINSWYLQNKSYREQKNTEHGYRQILEEAGRDRKAQFTKDQIASMAKEMQRLEESIKRDIPQRARRVFLEDQLAKVKEDLAQGYLQYEEIISKLSDDSTKLPDQIQRSIEKSIMPAYIANKRENKRLQWLLIIAIFLIVILNWNFFAGVIPVDWIVGSYSESYPISWLIIYFVFTAMIASLISQISLGMWIKKHAINFVATLKSKKKSFKAELLSGAKLSIVLLMIMFMVFSPLIYMGFTQDSAQTGYGESYFDEFVPMPLSSVPLTILCAIPPSILLFLIYDFFATRKQRIAKDLSSDTDQQST
jgi:hypothetical protein